MMKKESCYNLIGILYLSDFAVMVKCNKKSMRTESKKKKKSAEKEISPPKLDWTFWDWLYFPSKSL